MPLYIMKLTAEDGTELFGEWSTISDAPYSLI